MSGSEVQRKNLTELMQDALGEEIALEEEIYHLRCGGMTLAEIAARKELTYGEVAEIVRRRNDRISKTQVPADKESVKQLALDRYEMLLQAVWFGAMQGDTKDHDQALKVINAIVKLHGLDRADPTDLGEVRHILISGITTNEYADIVNSAQQGSAVRDNEIEGRVVGDDR